jgi:AcrR family transcriptional regulator
MISARALRDRHRSETRELILTAAREAFVREGHADFTMRELAQLLGCSPGAIYVHFASKEQLLNCLVEESFAKLLELLDRVPTVADPTENLKARLRAYVDFGLRYPYHYHFAFLLPTTALGQRAVSPLTPHEAFGVLRRSVGECRSHGVMRAVDEETASQALWAAVHGITSLLIAKPEFPWVERGRLIASVVDMAVDGLVGMPAVSGVNGRPTHLRGDGARRKESRHGGR